MSAIFEDATRSAGDRSAVFEYDGDTGYFYLYNAQGEQGRKVVAAIRVLHGDSDLQQEDVAIRWGADEGVVGLFIRGQLWAAFDDRTGARYGGDYQTGARPEIPCEIADAFDAA
jgi:hypothetical protein